MKSFKSAIWTSIFLVVWSVTPSLVAAQDNQREEEVPGPPEQSASVSDQNVPQPSQQPSDSESTRNDPPGRVARLQYMTGSVSVQPRGTDEWVQGSVNRPLTTSDNIWADKSSRAELSLGSAVLRIGAESSLTLTNVSDDSVQMQLHQGSLNVHIRHLFGGEIYEVDTPNQAFTIMKPGDYRFDVETSGDATVVTVRRGEGEATGQGPSVRVKSGRQVRFTGGTSLQHEMYEAPSPDGFDEWCHVRDRRQDHSITARYVGPGTVGYEDLDDYGYWRDDPEYGHIWYPRHVVAGWSPYHYGHWTWVWPWGWTWVDDAPWGFAPFHYGRWAYAGGYWGWVPGPYYARPYYAPALVVWFGGPRWGFSGFGGGVGFGWCALGWREPFYPWYGGSRHYFRNVNITNTRITNITNITNNYYGRGRRGPEDQRHFANMNRPGGFTAVSRNTIMNGQPVGRNAANVPANFRRNAPSLRQVDATPTREARLGVNAGQRANGAPQGVMSRPTVSKLPPPMNSEGRGRGQGGNQFPAGRPGMNAQSGQTPVTRGPNSNGSTTGTAGRYVPRPSSSMGNGQIARGPEHAPSGSRGASDPRDANVRTERPNSTATGSSGRYVPRPPASMGNGNGTSNRGGEPMRGGNPVRRGEPMQRGPQGDGNRGVVRPPAGSTPRPAENSMPSAGPSRGGPNYGGNNVPHPTGPVRSAPRDYPMQSSRGESPRASGGYRGDGGYSGYGRPRQGDAPRGYGEPSQGGSYSRGPSGNYGGRSAPPSGGGGRPTYGGGGGGGGRPQGGGSGGHEGGGGRGSAGHGSGGRDHR